MILSHPTDERIELVPGVDKVTSIPFHGMTADICCVNVGPRSAKDPKWFYLAYGVVGRSCTLANHAISEMPKFWRGPGPYK